MTDFVFLGDYLDDPLFAFYSSSLDRLQQFGFFDIIIHPFTGFYAYMDTFTLISASFLFNCMLSSHSHIAFLQINQPARDRQTMLKRPYRRSLIRNPWTLLYR